MTDWTMTYLKIRKHDEWVSIRSSFPQFKGKTKLHCYSFQKGKQGSAKQQGEQGEWGDALHILTKGDALRDAVFHTYVQLKRGGAVFV